MRAIEFRAWDLVQEKLLPVESIDWKENCITLNEGDNSVSDTFEMFELEQFTGLLDKSGKKIFRGDILKSKYGGIGTIKFRNSWGAFYYSWLTGRNEYGDIVPMTGSSPFYNDADEYEIIGNIHQNKELLGENEK